ncbi:MAG: PspC domain-containing protein [Actinomycetota bacterium]
MYWSRNELHRIPEEAMVGGVCAGLARYFEIDEAIVRACFLASVIFGGFGLALYMALWVLVEPAEPEPGPEPPPPPVEADAEISPDDLGELAQNPAPTPQQV